MRPSCVVPHIIHKLVSFSSNVNCIFSIRPPGYETCARVGCHAVHILVNDCSCLPCLLLLVSLARYGVSWADDGILLCCFAMLADMPVMCACWLCACCGYRGSWAALLYVPACSSLRVSYPCHHTAAFCCHFAWWPVQAAAVTPGFRAAAVGACSSVDCRVLSITADLNYVYFTTAVRARGAGLCQCCFHRPDAAGALPRCTACCAASGAVQAHLRVCASLVRQPVRAWRAAALCRLLVYPVPVSVAALRLALQTVAEAEPQGLKAGVWGPVPVYCRHTSLAPWSRHRVEVG